MSHSSRVANQGFHTAKALSKRDKLQALEESADIIVLMELKRDHHTAVLSLTAIYLKALTAFKSGVVNVLYSLMSRRNSAAFPAL